MADGLRRRDFRVKNLDVSGQATGNIGDLTAMPALSSGNIQRFMDLTGCVGILSNCTFGCATQGAGLLTFKAAGTGANVPATVFMSGNYGEADTEGDTGYIYRAA